MAVDVANAVRPGQFIESIANQTCSFLSAMAVDVANAVRPGQFIESIDVNDPEYIRQLLRPSVIKEDVKLMQQRARVSLILRSTAFRRELEKIVASQMKNGCLNANVAALKQLLDYLTPHARFGSSNFTRTVVTSINFQFISYKPCTIGTLVPAATVSITGKRECGTYNEALEAK
ncbi:beta-adducin, partial [Clonorchis sinensis]